MAHQDLKIWRHVTLFDGERTQPDPMTVVVAGEKIETVCRDDELDPRAAAEATVIGTGGVLTPGLVDCHTHLVFGGQRAGEFELRLEGASYADIARAGGGILSTVRATRAASEDELLASATTRLQALIEDGVTTVEIKSGYGLDLATELKMLRVARRLGEALPIRVVPTLLGAHAIPPEYEGRADAYVDLVRNAMIPAAASAGLAEAVDVFCETIAFSVAQCERVFQAAARHGLRVKAHAEQLSNLGGAAAAARRGAISADHLEHLDAAGVEALRRAGTVAVLLPGAFYTLRDTHLPPIDALRAAGVSMALGSDGNPGSSPIFLPTLTLNQACVLFRLTPREALSGMTANAARALGHAEIGRIAPGLQADFCVWNVGTPAELAYAVQAGRLRQRVFGGRVTNTAS